MREALKTGPVICGLLAVAMLCGTAYPGEPLKVFILAGQSNMEGHGEIFGTTLGHLETLVLNDPANYASPLFHIFTGYTLIGAFFLATEDSSSPVNYIPMLIYGAGAGILTVLIRNIGADVDGVALAILLMNLVNPIVDKIRPKALGKVV